MEFSCVIFPQPPMIPEIWRESRTMQPRNRIAEIVVMKGAELVPCPENWRAHTNQQRDVLRAILDEVGQADVLKGWRRPDGRVQLIDGHLRAEEFPDTDWQVAILDVDDKEAAYILGTMDSVGAMAEADAVMLSALMDSIETDSAAVQEMLDGLAGAAETDGGEGETEAMDETLLDQAVQLRPSREYAVIMCDGEEEWERLKRALALEPVRKGGYKRGSPFDTVAMQRVVPAKKLFDLMEGEADAGGDTE